MGFVQRRLVKFVIRVVTYPKLTLAVCGLLLIASVVGAWYRLELSTDQNNLLTPKLGFFRDYIEFADRFPENDSFVVILEPRDYSHPPLARRWMEFADRLVEKLKQVKPYVQRVDSHVPLDKLGDQGLLFDDWPSVEEQSRQMRQFLPVVKVVGESPGLSAVLLGENPTQRFYNFLRTFDFGADSSQLVTVVTRSLGAALKRDPADWRPGVEIPDLTDADPDAQYSPVPYGYNMVPDETKRQDPAHKNEMILVINVYTDSDYTSLEDITAPLTLMRNAVDGVARDYPEFKHPGITGRPALDADEMRTSDHDTKIAEILGLSLVFVMLLVFLRNIWLVIVAETCLATGIGWTFGWATLSIHRLNLLSLVFVIALIGIGMDYLIQVLTRYRFEKKRYTRPQAVWARVFRYVRCAPVSTACLGAAGAFFASWFTDFVGAGELGVIAGGGLLLCLASGYTVLPALLTLYPASVGTVPESRRYRDRDPLPRAGGWRLITPLVWILVAAGGVALWWPPQFDPNLLKLQANGLESVRLVRKLRTWYGVVMTEDLEKLRRARAALTPAAGDKESTIASTDSILDAMDKQAWLAANNKDLREVAWAEPAGPSPAQLKAVAGAATGLADAWKGRPGAGGAELQKAIQALDATLSDPKAEASNLVRLAAWQKDFQEVLKSNVGMFTPGPLDLDRLPAELRDHYVSYGLPATGAAPGPGTGPATRPAASPARTYALYIYPKQDLWDQGRLEAFVSELERRFPTPSPDGILTGIAHQLYHSTEAIHRAFMLATGYALILIFLLVLMDMRNLWQTLAAISVLALGLPMLLLVMWVWRKLGDPYDIPGTWNFANFFALPILIGAGHEYGVFMVHRYRETLDDPRRVWRPWDVSDRALLLCAVVTSCSFGFLIRAEHHGLASLGWVMAVGSACIYLATLLVLRPILQWRIKRKGVYDQNGAGVESSSR